MAVRVLNFVNNEFAEPSTGAFLRSDDPATRQHVADVPLSGAADVEAAVAAARGALAAWGGSAVAVRAAALRRVAALLGERLESFALAESADQGKPVALARAVDIPRAIANFLFFASAIEQHREMSTEMESPVRALNYTVRRPVGVCGLISPWNLPLYLLTWKIAPAIAVGNTCVCKPSEFTSLTAFMLCGVLRDAGVPPGVVNMVFGDGPGVGAVLAAHPAVPLLSFTGSTLTGERIALAAAPFHKKLSLELGGKNATLVFADADLARALPTLVRSAFANQGEICLCGSRIFVQDALYDTFVEQFVREVRSIRVGDPRDPATVMGALVSEVHYAKVMRYIQFARDDGGTVLCGGKRPDALPEHCRDGFFVEPTVVVGLAAESRCCREEIFGPVVTIGRFTTEADAVALANAVEYGLAASVWTENLGTAHRVSQALEAGTVWVNCWMARDLRVPFGGMKSSGVGREGGEFSIDFYTEQKNICVALQ